MAKLTEDDRSRLLGDLQGMKGGAAEANDDILKTFLPLPAHAGALREQTLIIRGERGAGKTAFFRFLEAANQETRGELFPDARIPDSSWIEGFSEQGMAHPSTSVLASFAQHSEPQLLRGFWMGHLACLLYEGHHVEQQPPEALFSAWKESLNEPNRWAKIAVEHVGALAAWTDNAEAALEHSGRSVVVTYDYLDRIGRASRDQASMAGALMALWQSLTLRYKRLRPKIFLREDLFESSQRNYPDASKLRSRSVLLQWDAEALYRVLLRHMSVHEGLRDWLKDKFEFEERGQAGWFPPSSLPGKKSFGEILMARLVGERMGKGEKKAFTHRWIPNRLQDAHQRIVPRAMLDLIGNAAEHARHHPRAKYLRLLTPADLSHALTETSKRRVAELLEEHTVVGRLEQLRGMTVMLKASQVEQKLKSIPPGAGDDGFGNDGAAVMEELLRLGVLNRRGDGRIDVPDIYRAGFDIKRKGSIAAAR